MSALMKIRTWFPFAFLVFFLNTTGLPHGLLYTTILTPFLYVWMARQFPVEPVSVFFILFGSFLVIHFINGVDVKTNLISILNLLCIYIFCCAFFVFLKRCDQVEHIFRKLLTINFILCLIAIPFYFTSWHELFWIEQYLTEGVTEFRRLKMFTYEASYYATLFTPLFFFFFLQVLFRQNTRPVGLLLTMMLLPLLLSFSLGVLACILLAVLFLFFVYMRRLLRKKTVMVIVVGSMLAAVFTLMLLWVFFPDNPLFVRIINILSGSDSSGRGRTTESFMLALKIAELKSSVWGIGLGQIKILGADIIRNYYDYPADFPITIPNATAETLAIFGWSGFFLRLATELFLFFYTAVWKNYYRLLLFIFIFIYQFTGSYITNIAEYIIWILAFTNIFQQFDVNSPARKNTPACPNHFSYENGEVKPA